MEKPERPIDMHGVITEGFVSGRLKSEDVADGLCWLTDKSRIEMGIFKEEIEPFVKSMDKIKSFLSVNNPHNLEKIEISEKEYARCLMESVVFRENNDLVNLVNKNSKKVYFEASVYKDQRSLPMIALQMFLTIREHIYKNYPNLLTTMGDKWVQCAYRH